jgi:hypothetical protein
MDNTSEGVFPRQKGERRGTWRGEWRDALPGVHIDRRGGVPGGKQPRLSLAEKESRSLASNVHGVHSHTVHAHAVHAHAAHAYVMYAHVMHTYSIHALECFTWELTLTYQLVL